MNDLKDRHSLAVPEAGVNELRIHVIRPRWRIRWSSPRFLTLSSALNSMDEDYAPIGHFAVELRCADTNAFGVSHVFTGMERVSKAESRRIVLREKLGLGSLVHAFAGVLQTRATVLDELSRARRDGRLRTIVVPASAARCRAMMRFLENWIESGAHQVYGGGKNTEAGEGAGCADFARVFFELATGRPVPEEWLVRIRVPVALMGGSGKRVSLLRLLLRGSWARQDEPSVAFATLDANRVFDWMDARIATADAAADGYLQFRYENRPEAATEGEKDSEPELRPFLFRRGSPSTPESLWAGIAHPT